MKEIQVSLIIDNQRNGLNEANTARSISAKKAVLVFCSADILLASTCACTVYKNTNLCKLRMCLYLLTIWRLATALYAFFAKRSPCMLTSAKALMLLTVHPWYGLVWITFEHCNFTLNIFQDFYLHISNTNRNLY